MDIERERLLSLIEFADQSARLRMKPVGAISDHKLFVLYEHDIQELPGVRLNVIDDATGDEIWLAIRRLHETRPPEITEARLRPWVVLSSNPNEQPRLRDTIEAVDVPDGPPLESKPDGTVETIPLDSYAHADEIRERFSGYLETVWGSWAEDEKLRRRTIRLYADLFTLKQQFEGAIVEAQLELVWGVGVGIWRSNGRLVSYPIITRLVEVSLNPDSAEIEVRPREADARVELDWFASEGNPGVANLEKAAKEFLENPEAEAVSPFDQSTFEPVLRAAAANLDANGSYWPDKTQPSDRALPSADHDLRVTDTWALFARPRAESVFLQDLERLRTKVEQAELFPPAVAALVTDPAEDNPIVELPAFRGVSASYYTENEDHGSKPQELYFPKPFNDEQVRIIQLLEVSDGVVVQGPPGTGKTHTIANVICHYLAEGKRVLVTSMKDPALAVLQQQLPEEIQPLAISLLTSEREGMKQFEHAINKIASDIQSLDRANTAREIAELEERVDVLHANIARVDRKIDDWARQNLATIVLDGRTLAPREAAQSVVDGADQFDCIPDALGLSADFAPRFSDADVVALREARLALGIDIDYLDASLPGLRDFPEAEDLLRVHQDLSQLRRLQQSVDTGEVPPLADSTEETLGLAVQVADQIAALRELRRDVNQVSRSWTSTMHSRLQRTGADHLLSILEEVGRELEEAMAMRARYLERPVTAPDGIELNPELTTAVGHLADGRRPFGVTGAFTKGGIKKQLRAIRVLGAGPASVSDWEHVKGYIALLRKLRELALRWNAVAPDLSVDTVPEEGACGGIEAAEAYAVYQKVKSLVDVEAAIRAAASHLLPAWAHCREVADKDEFLTEFENALQLHLTRSRLAGAWARREQCERALDGRSGRIVGEIRRFMKDNIGNEAVSDGEMQSAWSALMSELSRVASLSVRLTTVDDACQKVKVSGAPLYAQALKQPLLGTNDSRLPDNWLEAWRLRRLDTYLKSIDGHEELKELAATRAALSNDLSHAYRDIVTARTWLRLADNASPRIRAALQAYLRAVSQFGRTGRGKKAMRARIDARVAAEQANPAVPCWIMPHYRVSESLPAELGCFDLVVIDEASQSDLTALPALLRAKKALIVGDDKQVSPEAVGLDLTKVFALMERLLRNQVKIFYPLMSPARSIYDLFKVVFATSSVMLKEHFRSVAPIVEYSKREFYNHELRPLRVPTGLERLDPPLIDVLVLDGFRKGDINPPEARFIVNEIKAVVADPAMDGRSIGVVSLLGHEQALRIWDQLNEELGPEAIERHRIRCGDARTFQGNERDIVFLSLVAAPNQDNGVLSGSMYDQRFNVGASRARDRMYLVRSIRPDELSAKDMLRRSLIAHFAQPFQQGFQREKDLRELCESDFERALYDDLTRRGYRVTPQVGSRGYRIDLVVEGDKGARLAVECDGDRYHGPDKWASDMQRQRVLERAGWSFWRCFASAFVRRHDEMVADLLATLAERGIEPIGSDGADSSIHTAYRPVTVMADGGRTPSENDAVSEIPPSYRADGDVKHDETRGDAGVDEALAHEPPVPESPSPSADEIETVIDGRVGDAVTALAHEGSGPTLGDSSVMIESMVTPPGRVSETQGNGQPQASAPSSDEAVIPSAVEPRNAALLRNIRHSSPMQPVRSPNSTASEDEAAALKYARDQGLTVTDRRNGGGALWIVGGPEHGPALRPLGFQFTRWGGRVSKNQPAWFLRGPS